MSYYLPSPYNAVNEEVRKVQRQLNTLRSSHNECRGQWDSLSEDGIYGPRTAEAVMKFQLLYHLTSPQQGALGDTTIQKIKEVYEQLPSWRASSRPFLKAAPQSYKYQFDSGTMNTIKSFVSEVVDWIKDLTDTGAQLLKLRHDPLSIKVFLSECSQAKLDKQLNHINKEVQKYLSLSSIDEGTRKLANEPIIQNGIFRPNVRNAQQKVSKASNAEHLLRHIQSQSSSRIDKLVNDIIARLKKVRFSKKVTDTIRKGLTESNLQKVARKAGIAGAALAFSDVVVHVFYYFVFYKDFNNDPILYEQWLRDFINKLSDIADGLIDGLIAELLVLGVGALFLTSGVPVLIGTIIVLILSVIIGIFRGKKDFSYTQFLFDNIGKFGQWQIDRINRGQLEVGKI